MGEKKIYSPEACQKARAQGWVSRLPEHLGSKVRGNNEAFAQFWDEQIAVRSAAERQALADQIGVSVVRTCEHYANGRSVPTQETWEKIQAIFPAAPQPEFRRGRKPVGRPGVGVPGPRSAEAVKNIRESREYAKQRKAERAAIRKGAT